MPRRGKQKPPKRSPTGPLRQSYSQLLPDVVYGLEDQSTAHIPLNGSPASAARNFVSADNASTASTNDTSMTRPIDSTTEEPIGENQDVLAAETPIQLEVELMDGTGNTTVETRTVPASQVAKAQKIIADATKADEVEQNKAIDEAIQLLYPYAPREGQRNALRQLIYKRKDDNIIAAGLR